MPSCVYIMDKRKKKKTNKKKSKPQELSIGNLRKTEMNCAQCQKQLFGLWKNESFQSCLECSNKKVDVLTMLKSMNRVCEVRVNSQIVENAVIMRTLSSEDTEMEQSKDEGNGYIGRNVVKNEKQYVRDSENKNLSPDLKEEKIAQRTRRSLNLRNHADQYIDNCKSNCVSNELIESVNEDNLNSNNETYVTGNVENGDSETVSIIKTRRRSSLQSTVLEEFPENKVPIASESIQEDNMSKRPRKTARLHTKLSVENNLNKNMVSVQHGYNKRRQLPIEESTISKLAKGRKRGNKSENIEDDDSSSAGKISKNQPEVFSENKVCDTKDKNINCGESRKRRPSSAFKEIISSESPCEKINENRNLQKARRIHNDVSPEDKKCDKKNEKKAQTEESIQKETDSKSISEVKRLNIEMENYHVSAIERIKRRSSRASQNTSPSSCGNNKNIVNGSVDSKRRTRASLNTSDKTITKPDVCVLLGDILSNVSQGVEHDSGDKKKQDECIKESKIKTKESQPKLVSVKLSTQRKGKQQGIAIRQKEKKPLNAKQKPPIPARTLELLRSTRGMKPVVLVEKMMTVKQKVAQQSAKNEKKGNSVGQTKKRTVCNFNKNSDTSSVESVMAEQVENKHIPVSEKSEKPIRKEGSNIDSKVACDPEQKRTTLRTLGKGEQSKLYNLNGNHVENSGGNSKMKCVKTYQSLGLRNLEMKKKKPGTSGIGTKANNEIEQTPKSFPCEKCEKCFVNVLQLKSHELMHRGYFELKLERIDTKTIHKTEGEIISKDIINYILESVFAKETDNVCEVYKDEVYDCAELHPNIPEEICDATGNSKYELKNVQVTLKRIDLREAIAMNKSNESVIVASSIMNNILKHITDKTGEEFIYAHGKPGNVDFDNYNKTREVESSVSELEENVNDDPRSQECFGNAHSEGQEVGTVEIDPDCEQTDKSPNIKHSENCNKVYDSSEVISNNESELDKDESNNMFESEDTDNINEDTKFHETNSSEKWSHRSTDYEKDVLYNNRNAQRTDHNLDSNLLININKLNGEKNHLVGSSISEIISNEGTETLPDTSIVSRTEFVEDADTVLTSKDSAEPGTCKKHKEGIEDNKINEVQEGTSDVDTRICEYSGTVSGTRCEYNEKMISETDEVDIELGKEKAGNGKSTELQNTTNDEEICSYIVTSNMDKTDSDTSLEVSKDDDDDDNDDDDDDDDNNNDDNDDDCGSGSDDSAAVKSKVNTSESQHSGDKGDIAETNKSVSICNNDDNNKSGDISIEFSTYTDVNNIDEIFSEDKKNMVSEQSESSDSDSDKITCKNEESIVSTQEESSVSKHNIHEHIDDKDCLANKSENTGFDEPCKQEVQHTHESLCNTDYDTIDIVTFTHVSANVENRYTVCKQETESTCNETSVSKEQQSLTLNDKSIDKSDVLVPQDTDTTNQHDLEVKHFNIPQDNNRSETNLCKWGKEELINNFENPCSEFVSDIESKSSAAVKVEDGSSDRTGSDDSENQIFVTVSDSVETTLHNASNNFVQVKSNDSEVNNENKRMSENTLENDAANESNYKSMEKYLESFIKDFIVRNTERTESNVESSIQNENENEEMEKLIVDVAPTKDTCTTNITSDYIVTEKTSEDDSTLTEGKCSSNSSSDYVTTEKTGPYNDSLQNMTGMLFDEICLSSDMERKSQKMNEKESLTPNSFSTTFMSKNQIQLTSTEEINDCTTSADTGGGMYRLSGNKNETASPTSYVSDTGTMINYRLSVNDVTKADTQGQFCPKSETDFSTTRKYSISDTQRQSSDSSTQRQPSNMSDTQRQSSDMSSTQRQSSNMSITLRQSSDGSSTQRQSSDMSSTQKEPTGMSITLRQSSDMSSTQRQSSDKMQSTLPSSGSHITYTIQKQSYDRREHDSGTSNNYTDNTRRYSGDRWQSESSSDSVRRHSNDRREVDYSTAGTSNTHQRSVVDNRRHYTESHESRPYVDPRDNRGNSYGSNWRNPIQNRTHPYQHNTNKWNDRGSYSNWRWPGPNNYSHYRQNNNWR